MTEKKKDGGQQSQGERFKEAARALGADEDEAKFNAALKKVAGQKTANAPKIQRKPKADK